MAWLEISGPSGNQKADLTDAATSIGRSKRAMIRVPEDKMVSGIHCIIYQTPEGYLLRDHNSTNGTRLNGKLLLEGRKLLKDGDRINIGKTTIIFHAHGSAAYQDEDPDDGTAIHRGGFFKRLARWFRGE